MGRFARFLTIGHSVLRGIKNESLMRVNSKQQPKIDSARKRPFSLGLFRCPRIREEFLKAVRYSLPRHLLCFREYEKFGSQA